MNFTRSFLEPPYKKKDIVMVKKKDGYDGYYNYYHFFMMAHLKMGKKVYKNILIEQFSGILGPQDYLKVQFSRFKESTNFSRLHCHRVARFGC